jgi:hypothetical protein
MFLFSQSQSKHLVDEKRYAKFYPPSYFALIFVGQLPTGLLTIYVISLLQQNNFSFLNFQQVLFLFW